MHCMSLSTVLYNWLSYFTLKYMVHYNDKEKILHNSVGSWIGRRLSWPFTILVPYILYTRGGVRCCTPPYAYPLSHCIKLLCNFHVSVKVYHSTLVYIVYYNVQLLVLLIYICHTFLFYNIFLQVYMNNPII